MCGICDTEMHRDTDLDIPISEFGCPPVEYYETTEYGTGPGECCEKCDTCGESAATSECPVSPPLRPCERPDVLPDCSVVRPLLRVSFAHAWRERLIGDVIRSPEILCFVFEEDKLSSVAMVSTLDIMRAIGR